MIRPAVKYGLEALGVLVTAVTVLLALLVWRLAAGPVPLSFLNETILEQANAELQEGKLALQDTMLRWVPDDRQLVISLLGVELHDAADEPVVTVPEIRIDLRARSLLRGNVALQSVELVGVSAAIVRRPGTGVQLALAENPDQADAEAVIDLEEVMTQIAEPPNDSGLLSELQSFGMRNASLRFLDKINDVEWVADDATLELSRSEDGVSAFLDAELVAGDARLDLEMLGSAPAGADRVVFQAKGSGFVPAALARNSPMFTDLALLDAPVSGEGTVTIGRNGVWLGAELDLTVGSGEAVLPDGRPPLAIDGAVAELTLDPAENILLLKRLDFEAGNNKGTVSGNAVYDQPDGFHISGATVALNVKDLFLDIDGFTDGVADIDAISFTGRLDFDNLAADISALSIRVGEGVLALSGRIADHPESPAILAQGEASNISTERLRDIWPKPLAKGARDWFDENVTGGTIDDARINIDLAGGMIAAADRREALPDEALDLEFTLSGATVRYLRDMPPMQRVAGRGVLQGDRFDAWVDRAFIDIANDRLQINSGHFAATALHVRGGPGEIKMSVAGATATVLALLDHPPLGFISRFGMDPAIVGGYGDVQAFLTLPLSKDVTMDDVGFSGRAVAREVGLPNVIEGVSIDGGELVIEVERRGLRAEGPITLNGVPVNLTWDETFESGDEPSSVFRLRSTTNDEQREALRLRVGSLVNGPVTSDVTVRGSGPNLVDGTVAMMLTDAVLKEETILWSKPAGSPAQGRFNLLFEDEGKIRLNAIAIAGAEIDLSGSVLLADNGDVLEIVLPHARLGTETEASFRAMRLDNGVLEMHAEGPRFDARGVLTNLFSGSAAPVSATEMVPQQNADGADTASEIEIAPLPEITPEEETNIALTARFPSTLAHGNVRAQNVDVDLLILKGETQRLVVSGDIGASAKLRATISPTPDGKRAVAAQSDAAGSVLRGIDFYQSMQGGRLDLTGTFDDTVPGAPLDGKIIVDNFRIVNAPLLANLLTVGSLTGIGDTLQGEGIRFVRLDMPFQMTTERFHVLDARMSGPAIGLSIKGQVDRREGIFDLNGTIVPAYTLNSALGAVPILGDILVGRDGEGIFAATYAMRGTTDQPIITVNPLAALAPGFLRRIFEFGEIMEPEVPPVAEAPTTADNGTSPAPGLPAQP